jgi:hypothetical protein
MQQDVSCLTASINRFVVRHTVSLTPCCPVVVNHIPLSKRITVLCGSNFVYLYRWLWRIMLYPLPSSYLHSCCSLWPVLYILWTTAHVSLCQAVISIQRSQLIYKGVTIADTTSSSSSSNSKIVICFDFKLVAMLSDKPQNRGLLGTTILLLSRIVTFLVN